MNDKPKRQVNRTWDEAERKKHGEQVRERFARERDEMVRLAKQVIEDLLDQGLTISQNEVARQSGISVGFINKHLKLEVERARKKQLEGVKKPKTPRQVETVEKEVERLRLFNRRLKDDLEEEKRKNKELLAQVAKKIDLENEIKTLKAQTRELLAYHRALQEKVVNLPVQQKTASPEKPIEREEVKQPSHPEPERRSIEAQLQAVGITLNPTLKRTIKSASEEKVLDAIEAYNEALATGKIECPKAWLKKAIEEGWKPNNALQAKSEMEIFNEWFPLARHKGIVMASQRGKNGMEVYVNDGGWVSLSEMLEKYPMETLGDFESTKYR